GHLENARCGVPEEGDAFAKQDGRPPRMISTTTITLAAELADGEDVALQDGKEDGVVATSAAGIVDACLAALELKQATQPNFIGGRCLAPSGHSSSPDGQGAFLSRADALVVSSAP